MTVSKLRIALVSCASKKLDVPAPASELYVSDLFRKSRAYAERHADAWLVLSAAHGVVEPASVLAPYDVTLSKMGAADVRAWGKRVADELAVAVARIASEAGRSLADVELVLLAGERYASFRVAFETRLPAVRIVAPLDGMQIGERLSFLKRELSAAPANRLVATEEAALAARAGFDAACQALYTIHLRAGFGQDRARDAAMRREAQAAVELARDAWRAAHDVFSAERRRAMRLDVEEAPAVEEAVVAFEAPTAPVAEEAVAVEAPAPVVAAPLAERPAVARAIELAIREAWLRQEWELSRAELWSLPTFAPRAVELRQAAAAMLQAMQTAGNAAWRASHELRDLLPRGDYYRARAVIRDAVATRPIHASA